MKAVIINDVVYKVVNDTLVEAETKGQEYELKYKIWSAHMDLYCQCNSGINDCTIINGKIYDVTDQPLVFRSITKYEQL